MGQTDARTKTRLGLAHIFQEVNGDEGAARGTSPIGCFSSGYFLVGDPRKKNVIGQQKLDNFANLSPFNLHTVQITNINRP